MVKQFGRQGKGVFLRPSGVAEGFHYQDPSLRNPLLLFGCFWHLQKSFHIFSRETNSRLFAQKVDKKKCIFKVSIRSSFPRKQSLVYQKILQECKLKTANNDLKGCLIKTF